MAGHWQPRGRVCGGHRNSSDCLRLTRLRCPRSGMEQRRRARLAGSLHESIQEDRPPAQRPHRLPPTCSYGNQGSGVCFFPTANVTRDPHAGRCPSPRHSGPSEPALHPAASPGTERVSETRFQDLLSPLCPGDSPRWPQGNAEHTAGTREGRSLSPSEASPFRAGGEPSR